MKKDKHLSTTVSETLYTKTTTTKTQDSKCYCDGAWEIRYKTHTYQSGNTIKDKQVTKQPITHKNCPCDSKYTAFKKKHKEEYKDLKDDAVLQRFLEIEDFGPCVKCKGTGKQIFTRKSALAKYLCVNGPYTGQRFTTVDMDELEEDYCLFNNSHRGTHSGMGKNLKAIWVHEGSLKE